MMCFSYIGKSFHGSGIISEESKLMENGLLGYAAEEINTAWDGGGELIFKLRI
jgi:hypothetical protein